MKRRSILKAGAALAPGLLAACQLAATTAPPRRLERFGLQLSTVTPLMLADFEGTLETVAEIGYPEVEFSAMGFLGRSPAQVRKLLADNGLDAPVGRITPRLPEDFFSLSRPDAMKVFRERGQLKYLLDNVAQSLEAATALGQKTLVLPALMPDHFRSLDQVQRNIEVMNQAGELCARQGVVFGYHNHSWELAPLEGTVPYDLMIEQTDSDQVTYQLDAYWIAKGGGDLSDYLSRYPGRFSSCHMKDIDKDGDFADVGDGEIDFPRFTSEAVAQGAQYFFVERDNPPDPASSIRRSYAYLKQMTY
jgi:sugar phosphate isomerase/epimerase